MVKVNEKRNGSEKMMKLADCDVGTPIKLNGETNIIIEKNCHTVDVISTTFRKKMRLSSNLELPVASNIEITINW